MISVTFSRPETAIVPAVESAPNHWRSNRGAIARPEASRQFVDDVLRELAAHRFSLSAWATFIARSLARSLDQAFKRPTAAAEVTAIHLIACATGSRRWAFLSWLLCITHLGLLGAHTTLGWPNRLTVLRGLLPALAPNSRRSSVVALATDLADGHLARRGNETAFGAFADPIADGVFWSWFALRWEASRWLRWVPLTLFTISVGGISAVYFSTGRAIDYPRPVAGRYVSGATQLLLALHTLRAAAR